MYEVLGMILELKEQAENGLTFCLTADNVGSTGNEGLSEILQWWKSEGNFGYGMINADSQDTIITNMMVTALAQDIRLNLFSEIQPDYDKCTSTFVFIEGFGIDSYVKFNFASEVSEVFIQWDE